DRWVRGAALSSLVTLVAAGQKSREEILDYFADLYRGKLKRKWSNVWDELVHCTCELYPGELLEDIERAYDEGLIDPSYMNLDDVRRYLAKGKDTILARLAESVDHQLVEDTAAEMGWWECFSGSDDTPVLEKAVPERAIVSAPTVRETPKIGRNEPCPCGS